MSQKISETGWFYHAPARRKEHTEPVPVPPTSQIPGLSELPDDPSLQNDGKIWIRETDSDYIRLSKMGGRPDLLRQRSPKPASEEPVGYPRVDWFYLDDQMMQEQQQKEADAQRRDSEGPYQFMLPEYMVHQEYKPKGSGHSQHRGRAPFAHENTSAFEREGDQIRDKTVKLPELKQAGYGVRQEKQQGRPVKHMKMPPQQKGKPHPSEMDEGKVKYQSMPAPAEDQQPIMTKLLSYGYGQDWRTDRDSWQKKQQKMSERFDSATLSSQKSSVSEYQEKMGSAQSKTSGRDSGKASSSKASSARSEARMNKNRNQDTKELFKMSKFKNVPSKVESRRTANHHQEQNPDVVPA